MSGIFLDRGELERLVDAEGRTRTQTTATTTRRAPQEEQEAHFLENLFEGE